MIGDLIPSHTLKDEVVQSGGPRKQCEFETKEGQEM